MSLGMLVIGNRTRHNDTLQYGSLLQGSPNYLLLTKNSTKPLQMVFNNFKISSMFVVIFIFCPQILITKINFIQVNSKGWQS